jgi:transcriptional antiterminator RfaH
MLRWYLIYTKHTAEPLAQANLARQGFEVYFPRVLRKARRAGRWIEQLGALFPRYLFVRVNEERQSLAPLRSTIGISGVVKFGGNYSAVPDAVVEELQRRADPGSGLHRLQSTSPFSPGLPIRVASGPFAGLEGVFQRELGAERVLVLLQVLGEGAGVRIPVDSIVPQFAGSFA